MALNGARNRVAIAQARARLGDRPLRWLFEHLVRGLASAGQPGACFRGWNLVAIAGTTLAVANTPANELASGRPGWRTGRATLPKTRGLALLECGTRVLFGGATDAYRVSEHALAHRLYPLLRKGMLDPAAAPAHELAALYHELWEAETACAEVKVCLRQRHRYLRGQSPLTVRQECYRLLLAYYVVRGVMREAAAQEGLARMASQRRRQRVCRRVLDELLEKPYGPRRGHPNPCVVKCKYDSFPVKRNKPVFTPIPDISKHIHMLK